MIGLQIKTEIQLISFELWDNIFAIPINCVQEVISSKGLTAISREPSNSEKIINYRGENIPVVDMVNKLDIIVNSQNNSTESYIIILNINNEKIGLFANRIIETQIFLNKYLIEKNSSENLYSEYKHNNVDIKILNPMKLNHFQERKELSGIK